MSVRGRPRSEAWRRAPLILAAYLEGATAPEIARMIGCSTDTVQKILKDEGVVLRRGRPARP